MIRVLIADDDPLVREAIKVRLSVEDDLEVVGEASDGRRAVELGKALAPDLVLLDLHMPGSRGLSGLAALRGQFPAVAVMVVSVHGEPRVVRRVLDHGAAGFISKSASPDEIAAAIRTVLDCGEWVPPHLGESVAALAPDPGDSDLAARLARLTGQQYRVLGLLAEGLLNKQIADRLAIQERTVKAHVTAIFEKLGVRNRTQASMLLRSLDLVDPARVD